MGLFWFLQISSGLLVLQSMLYLLSRSLRLRQWPLWALVAGSGLLGSVLLSPVYWLIGEGLMEAVLGFPVIVDDENDLLPAAGFGWTAIRQEFSEIVGPVTAAWSMISWPRLQGLLPPLLMPHSFQPSSDATRDQANPPSGDEDKKQSWRAALPHELGHELIAVNSELQYLRVWTTRGSTLILGSLQEVENQEAMSGMRVHRSWWIHARHVTSVRRRAGSLVCLLSNGMEIPVSRRRKPEVLSRFGDAARYVQI
jgi:hypothetical protein